MFTACMAISACKLTMLVPSQTSQLIQVVGLKYFRTYHPELKAMLKILVDTHRDHGRPTKDVQDKIRRGVTAVSAESPG